MSIYKKRETQDNQRKTSHCKKRSSNNLSTHMSSDRGIDPGTHWWEGILACMFPCLHVGLLMQAANCCLLNYATLQSTTIYPNLIESTTIFGRFSALLTAKFKLCVDKQHKFLKVTSLCWKQWYD